MAHRLTPTCLPASVPACTTHGSWSNLQKQLLTVAGKTGGEDYERRADGSRQHDYRYAKIACNCRASAVCCASTSTWALRKSFNITLLLPFAGLLQEAINNEQRKKFLIDGFPRVLDQLGEFERQVGKHSIDSSCCYWLVPTAACAWTAAAKPYLMIAHIHDPHLG